MTIKKVSKKQVEHIAQLANLKLSKSEIVKFQEHLSEILNYVNLLNEANVSKVEPTSQVTGLKNVFREDVVEPSLTQEEALSNAPDSYKGYFKTKPVF